MNSEENGKMIKNYMGIINFIKEDNLRADLKEIK